LEQLYENIENRKLASPTPRTVSINMLQLIIIQLLF
jgi:hypothetical protein